MTLRNTEKSDPIYLLPAVEMLVTSPSIFERYGRVLLLAMSVLSFACVHPTDLGDQENLMSKEQIGVVSKFWDQGDERPLGVQFHVYAAIYFLARDNPRFEEWLLMLRKSHEQGSQLKFTYTVAGQLLTSLEEVSPAPQL